jgi:hypothetical protein
MQGHLIATNSIANSFFVPATAAAAAGAQAIITSLTSGLVSSSGQQLLVSTDRDGKVRASVLPADPGKVS